MIVKIFKASVIPLRNLSYANRRKRLLLERKGVDHVEYQASIDLLTVVSGRGVERFICSNCCFEVIDEEPESV